jgi:hypothetical protein
MLQRVLFGAVLLEMALLLGYFYREIVLVPPAFSDQASYLYIAYFLQASIIDRGWEAVWTYLQNPIAMSLLFPVEAAVSSLLFGGGRLGVFLINLLALATLQWMVYSTVAKMTGDEKLGLAGAALTLTHAAIWQYPGGALDMRIDFLAYCLFGMWVCAVLRSDVFLDRKWAAAAGVLAAFLILNRYITLAYVGSVLFVLATGLTVQAFWQNNKAARVRLTHLILSGAIVIACVAPFLWMARDSLWAYYGVGHITGPERAIRVLEQGTVTFWDHVTYYAALLGRGQLGTGFWVAAGLLAVMTYLFRGTDPERKCSRISLVFLALTVALPYVVLSAGASKSQIVGAIIAVPVTLLIIAMLANFRPDLPRWSAFTLIGAAVIVMATHASRPAPPREDRLQWAELAVRLYGDVAATGRREANVFFDTVSHMLNAATLAVFGAERFGKFLPLRQTFGNSIFAQTRNDALKALAESDYIVLTDTEHNGVYPFFASVAPLRPEIRAWTEANAIKVHSIPFAHGAVDIYRVPTARLFGEVDGWLRSKGGRLVVDGRDLERRPIIKVWGSTRNVESILKAESINVTATTEVGGRKVQIAGTLSFRDGRYEMTIDASPVGKVEGTVTFSLEFDRHFVPKLLGTSPDDRELVVHQWDRIRLLTRDAAEAGRKQ